MDSPYITSFCLGVISKVPWRQSDFAIQFSSVAQSCLTLCDPMDCSTPGLPVHHQLSKFTQTHIHQVGDAIQPSCPLSSPSSTFNFSQHRGLFQWVGSSYQVAKILELQFQHPSFHECSGWINFRIHWFDALAVQGTLKSLLQHDSSKASVLWHSAFFIVQFLHLHMATGKTIALTTWTFVGKVMSLVFNTLSRFVIAFLPRSNRLLISWLQSPFTVILEPKKRKSVTASTFSLYLPWSNRGKCHDLSFLIFSFKLALSLSHFTLHQEAP